MITLYKSMETKMSHQTNFQHKTECYPSSLTFIQSRAEINLPLVEESSQMMADGGVFDAVEGVQDETGEVFVWDGTHRGEAANQ